MSCENVFNISKASNSLQTLLVGALVSPNAKTDLVSLIELSIQLMNP